jgi:hypothetical protein
MPPLQNDRPPRPVHVDPPPPEDLSVSQGYDWRPTVTFGLLLAFIGFTMWLYH